MWQRKILSDKNPKLFEITCVKYVRLHKLKTIKNKHDCIRVTLSAGLIDVSSCGSGRKRHKFSA